MSSQSDMMFLKTVELIIGCYQARYPASSIFLSSQRMAVHYGHISIVESELVCMRDLLERSGDWRYLIYLAGSEQMLLTNQELVTHFSMATHQEALYVESFPMPLGNMFRVQKKHVLVEQKKNNPDSASRFFLFSVL